MAALRTVHVAALCALALALGGAACSGSEPAPPASDPTVEETLRALNVDTNATPRLDETKTALPEGYTPLGAAKTLDRTDELVTIGFRLSRLGSTFTVFGMPVTGSGATVSDPLPFTDGMPDAASTPWAVSAGDAPETIRAAASGDVDGDAVEEIVVAGYSPAAGAWLQVVDTQATVDGSTPPQFPIGDPLAIDVGGAPDSLALALGDFDGDGRADLVVAATSAAGVRLAFYRSGRTGFEPDGAPLFIAATAPSPTVRVELAQGNLDNDPGEELAVVVNETWLRDGEEKGAARWFVFDDAKAGHALRGSGRVQATVDGVAHGAVLAGVAIGDVDGDNVGELVLGGLPGLDPARACRYAYLVVALDDLRYGLATLGATYVADAVGTVPSQANPSPNTCSATDPLRLRKVHVRTLDIDAAGPLEIQVNQLTLALEKQATKPVRWTWTRLHEIPLEQLFGRKASGGTGVELAGRFDDTTSALVASDLTGDKKDDVAFVSQLALDPDRPEATASIRLYSVHGSVPMNEWHEVVRGPPESRLGWIALEPEDLGVPARPLLVPANVNYDSVAVRFSEGTHETVFTQPVVFAAIAAPPCSAQRSGCTTSYGVKSVGSFSESDAVKVTAGGFYGLKWEAGKGLYSLETEARLSVGLQGSTKSFDAFSLSTLDAYNTGHNEDGVLFRSAQYDLYTYTVTSHPDAAWIGREIVLALPRGIFEGVVERGYFNAHVPAADAVDGRVFVHTPGLPRSYRSAAEKDAILATHLTKAFPDGTTAHFQDLQMGPKSVGEGGGGNCPQIEVGHESGTELMIGVYASLELKVTAGVGSNMFGVQAKAIKGLTIGGSYEHNWRWSKGAAMLYKGCVPALPAGTFETDPYRWGLFVYVHDDPDRPFEIIDYWVER